MIQLGINGFGRIGRVILRACLQKSDLHIAAINDPAIDVEYICYLIKFDSIHGKFSGSISHTKDEIIVDDKSIKVFREKLPANVPWQTAGVQYVLETSGMFTTLEKASGHLASESVRRVLVTAPSADVPMLILGVNENKVNPGQKVISCTSSTLYCLAPIIKVLEDCYGLSEGFVTSIHAMTPSLKPIDGLCLRGKHWRDHRSIHQNIIPATTGACRALGKILPRVKDKLSGLAFRVPIVNVSVLDLTIRLNSNTTLQEIIDKVQKAGNATLKNIIRVSKDDAVSSDFIGETHSCILDADSSLQLKPNFFKLVCWYENEYSYACRVIDSVHFSEKIIHSEFQLKTTANSLLQHPKKQDSVQQTDCIEIEVMCSTSQDTGLKFKPQMPMLLLKKPLSSQLSGKTQPLVDNKESKKRHELFKIWNDEKEKPGVRQNRSSFFHSCVAITPQNTEQIDCAKAQERLEMLKKEFSKMVNITESLLKKSYTSNEQMSSENKTKKEPTVKDLKKGSSFNSSDMHSEEHEGSQNNRMFGDCKSDSCSNYSKPLSNEENCRKLSGVQLFNMRAIGSLESQNQNILQNADKHETNINDNIESKQNTNIASAKDETSCSEKQWKPEDQANSTKLNSLRIDPEHNFKVNCLLVNKHHYQRSYSEKDEKETVDLRNRVRNTDIKFPSIFKTNSSVQISKQLISELSNMCRFKSANKNENKQMNVDLNMNEQMNVDLNMNEQMNVEHNMNEQMNVDHSINEQTNFEKGSAGNQNSFNKDLNTKNVNIGNAVDTDMQDLSSPDEDYFPEALLDINRSSPERTSLPSDRTSKCGSPDTTSLAMSNVDMYKMKEDIYDKLDSISGTDSNNSFQINERKSQVINLCDLTTSVEDLARLDKICKIIEISDELSDKLFSALDNKEDGVDIRKKKWSFRDLCEKIKLDDFCENIFGKSKGKSSV